MGSTEIIKSNCLIVQGLNKSSNLLVRALSKCLLNIDRQGASDTSLESQFHCLTTITIKNFFQMSILNAPWQFVLFSHILSLVTREKRPTTPSPFFLLMYLERAVRLPHSLFFSRLGNPGVFSLSS